MRGIPVRVGLFLLGYLLLLLLASLPKGMAPPRFADLTWGISASLGILLMSRVFLKREHREARDVGLSPDAGSAVRLLAGVAMGCGVYACTLLMISWLVGPLHFTTVARPSAATVSRLTIGYLALSCMEELGFRGYALRTLIPAIGHWQAQLAIAVAFGLSHAAFGWPWQAIVLGVIPSALVFGAAATLSGGLAMPIGVHAAVNLAQWAVGEKDTPGFGTLTVDPSNVATATVFSPFIGAAVPLTAAALMFWWQRRRTRSTL